ncbi:free fatty acid receptor 4 [Anabrus simplex]|uniref:free fatty acid receptor 4 n=1 Tax=Anabrus simplex TaxID=316456 RepID=UPI0034DCCCE4
MAVNSSYVFGNDTLGGWGPRYFFTFYTEFGDRRGAAVAEVSLLLFIFLSSLLANISIAAAVLRYRELRTVTNCFLLNLAAADLVFALGIPAVAASRLSTEWTMGDIVCRILPYSQFVCGFVLLWTLTLISMDRHRCIVVPPYRSQLTPRLATVLTAATWFLAAVLFLPVAFWFHEQPADNGSTVCTLVFPKSDSVNMSLCFTIPVLLLACLLPMGLLVYHYQRIFQKLLATRSRWAVPCVVMQPDTEPPSARRDSELSFVGSLVTSWTRKISTASQASMTPNGRNGSLSTHEELRLNKHLRVVRVLLLNVVVVLLMWLPITILMFLIYVDGSRPNEDTNFFLRSQHFIIALLVALLNTVVNPLLYGVLSENFRACFLRLWFGSKKKSRDVCDIRTGASKSNLDVLQECMNRTNGTRTPSSGRANGYMPHKKMSNCSILESPNGNLV